MKFNKVIILCMCLSLVFSSFGFSEIGEVGNLSVEKATEMAIKNNKTFDSNRIDKMKIGRQIDSIKANVETLVATGVLTFQDKKDRSDPLVDSISTLNNSLESISDSEEIQRLAIGDTIQNLYVTIFKLESQFSALDDQIHYSEGQLSIDRKREKLGLISKYDLEKSFNTYSKLVRQKSALKTSIENLYVNLKELVGVKSTEKITLNRDFVQTVVIAPYSLSLTKEQLESKNIKLSNQINALKRASDLYTNIDMRYPRGSGNGEDAYLEIQKVELSIKTIRDSMIYKYETAGRALNDQFDNYKQKESDFKLREIENKNLKLKYNLGSASKNELELSELQLRSAKNDLELAKLDYLSSMLALQTTIKGLN